LQGLAILLWYSLSKTKNLFGVERGRGLYHVKTNIADSSHDSREKYKYILSDFAI
jgi:hypothetical protein